MSKEAIADFDHPKLEALVETLFLAAFADDEFGAEERVHFQKTVETLTDGRIDGPKLDELVSKFKEDLKSSGRPARLAAIKKRLERGTERRIALTLAIEMTAADGIIRTSERELILEVAEGLDIDRAQAADIVKRFEP